MIVAGFTTGATANPLHNRHRGAVELNDELGLGGDIEPDEDAIEAVKGGVALTPPATATAAPSGLQPARAGSAPGTGAPVTSKTAEGLL
jgi:hypothetical protein